MFAYVGVLPASMSMSKCLEPAEPEEDISSPGTGVPVSCELPHRCWEVNLGPLAQQHCYPRSHLCRRFHFLLPVHHLS